MTRTPATQETDAKVDRIVDDIVADTDTAEKLKEALHKTLDETDQTVTEPGGSFTDTASDDDADDLWDNIPV